MRQVALALTKPAELSVLFQSLAACAREVTAGFVQAESMRTKDPKTRSAT
jgi:hypothetical protein